MCLPYVCRGPMTVEYTNEDENQAGCTLKEQIDHSGITPLLGKQNFSQSQLSLGFLHMCIAG